ncbi:MAG: START-like domain-containing protein [Bacteroidia bacterium]
MKKVEEKKKVVVVEKPKVDAKPASKPAEKSNSKPVAPAKAPVVQKTEAKPVAGSHSATLNLPPLPRNFRIGKKKGKIIPGEKRVVKLETINHHVIKDKPIEPEKNTKAEPKGKFTVEQPIRSTVQFLYDFLSTPKGLIEWFSDEAELNGDTYTFTWDGATQQAKIINAKLDGYIRMRWLDKPAGTYFEMRIDVDPITAEIMLVITDFGENDNDIRNLRALWETQIHHLLKALVTY